MRWGLSPRSKCRVEREQGLNLTRIIFWTAYIDCSIEVLNRPIAFSLVHRPNHAPSLPSFFEDRRMAHPLIHKLASFFQEKNPPAFFTHKLFGFSMFATLAFQQVFSPGMANTGVLYDVAVTSFLLYVLAYATVEASSSSSSSSSRLPSWATDSLRWCVFFASSLSFVATASLLFRDSVRLVVFVALFFFINISAFALPRWVYETPIKSRWGWRRSKQFFMNIWNRLAGRSAQQAPQMLPLFHMR